MVDRSMIGIILDPGPIVIVAVSSPGQWTAGLGETRSQTCPVADQQTGDYLDIDIAWVNEMGAAAWRLRRLLPLSIDWTSFQGFKLTVPYAKS